MQSGLIAQLNERFTRWQRLPDDDDVAVERERAYAEIRQRNLLRQGMTRSQVFALLGKPYVYLPEGEFTGDWTYEEWRYSLLGGGLGIVFGPDHRTTGFVHWREEDHPTKLETWQ